MSNDLISRQAAIDEVERWLLNMDDNRTVEKMLMDLPSAQPEKVCIANVRLSEETLKELVEKAKAEIVQSMPAVIEPEQRWIPCSERLPAYGEDVLISIGGYCNVGHIVPVNEEEQYNWYFSGWYHFPNDVDAWMPLPEPYKEENDGND